MAYGNRYNAGWHNNVYKGYLCIDQDGYEGEPEDIKLKYDGIAISLAFEDWENPILGYRCEFEIINDRADYFELLPLLTAEEREYRIRVVVLLPLNYLLFEGYLNCDTTTQKYLHRQSIKLVASSYLSKLENLHPTSIDVLKNMTFIDILDEILTSTGGAFNIRVNSKLRAEGDLLTNKQTLFNKNGFYTEVFWEDDVERKSSLDILKSILKTFTCYIYWWQGYWYVERYDDIWQEGAVNYVEYATGTTYQSWEEGTNVSITKTVMDVHDLVFTDQSQTQHINPGLNVYNIKLEDKRLMNLVFSDLKSIQAHGGTEPLPDYRKWVYSNDDLGVGGFWSEFGVPKSVIKNSIKRTVMTNAVIDPWEGLYTTTKVTVNSEETELNITYKYLSNHPPAEGTDGWKNYKFKFHWYVRVVSPVQDAYISQSGDDWLLKYGATEDVYLQTIEKSGTDFDADTDSIELSITIPLGKVTYIQDGKDMGYMSGDYTIVIGFGAETISRDFDFCPIYAWYGDFVITTTGDVQPNVIEGTAVNTKFLNKKELTLQLYDMESYNYKNGVLRAVDLTTRTERWGTGEGEANIIEKGLCWKTSTGPTINDSKVICGTGYEAFTGKLTNLNYNTDYYVRAYAKDANNNVYYGSEKTFKTTDLTVGSNYQGGKILHIFTPSEPAETGKAGYVAGSVSGIICALQDVPYVKNSSSFWGSLSQGQPICPGAYKHELGWAQWNTELIDDNTIQRVYSCAKVMAYSNDGFDDWWWPTADELWLMRQNKTLLGSFYNELYWSSSELYDTGFGIDYPPNAIHRSYWSGQIYKKCWALNFANTSLLDTWDMNNWMRVRPVRYFSIPI